MATRTVLAIDIGTSSVKMALITESGELSSYSRTSLHPYYTDHDPADAWVKAVTEGASALVGIASAAAVCVTGNGPTLVPLDADLQRSAPAVTWIGTKPKPLEGCQSLYLPRLMAEAEQDPGLTSRSSCFIGCPEYITLRLTGIASTFLPDERFTPYIWDDAQLGKLGLDGGLFPPMVDTGERIGYVTAGASAQFGIPAGIPVFAGLVDFHAALLGCGTVRPGMTCDRAGTSEGINYLCPDPIAGDGLRTLPGITPGTWTVAGLLPASGEVFEWFRWEAGLEELSYTELTRLITMSAPQQEYRFYPVRDFSKDPGDPFAGGVFSDGGNCSDDPGKRGRAVVEGIGFSVRKALDLLGNQGCRVDSLRHCGGQARSYHWNYMKAQILRVPVEVPRIIDAELLGCAVVALTGLGQFGSLVEAAESLVVVDRIYSPLKRTALHYDSSYELWLAGQDPSSALYSS